MHSVGGWGVGAACRYLNWAYTGRISNPLVGPSNSSTLFFAMEVQKMGQNFPKRASRGLRPAALRGVQHHTIPHSWNI